MEWLKRYAKNSPILIKYYRKVKLNAIFKRSLAKKNRGKGNKFNFSSSALFINSKIKILGNNNIVNIDETCVLNNVTFYIKGNNNTIALSKNVIFNFGGEIWIEDDHCNLSIGENTSFENTHIAVTEPGSKIIIGKDCMFANDIDVRTGDSHSIIDTLTGKRINYAQDVVIGDHVWVASHVSILKGVRIMPNSIVATRSLVSKSFDEEGILIGGVPAKKLKDSVSWERARIYDN